ncbi:MAG TPA: hypothetical protein VI791_02280 [Patescibacteria group bacterium]|nr:hypothetical protein [Patescibacteria group bacterium]
MKYLLIVVTFLTLAQWPLSLHQTNSYKDIINDAGNYRHSSIIAPDDQAPLIINTKRSLYSSDFLGRFFNNKASFIWGRFKSNFFALIDPNNYFFGFHPREIIRENLNIDKFPFISLIFLLYGLFRIDQLKWGKKLLGLFFISVAILSLGRFDKVDFVLYPILAYFIVSGIVLLKREKPRAFLISSLFLIIFSIPQYLRAFVNLHS